MGANDLISGLTQALYVGCFVAVTARAIRRPLRASIDTAVFFAVLAAIIAEGWVTSALNVKPPLLLNDIAGGVLMALPYLLLRLVDDFANVPRWLLHAAEGGLLLAVIGLFAVSPLPGLLALVYVVYFLGLQIYTATMFVRTARRSSGVTRRRMEAVAIGSLFLGLAILGAGFQAALPDQKALWQSVSGILALASGLAYVLGFAPPDWLRRAWQEPELRAFLSRAASLPRLPDTASIVRELEEGTRKALGAPFATIALWGPAAESLRSTVGNAPFENHGPVLMGGLAFRLQRAIFSPDTERDDPANAEVYRRYGARALMVSPITAGQARLGVLLVYAPRAPIFAEDDLVLVQLLADQAAVILESRALIDEAARVQAREVATRLKDDFLSAAAHDLKTPLTTLIAQAQLLERRALRRPEAPIDLAGIQRIVSESKRLQNLVTELLDANRLERGSLVGEREQTDLVAIARAACDRHTSAPHRCVLESVGDVQALVDRGRVEQVIENLVENAIKYSPDGGDVRVRLQCNGTDASITVSDRGIGIPAADLPQIFDRFHRGANVDDRRFAGLGLGLYICRGIVEQHGGRIWATSTVGQGTTFHVTLPMNANVPVAASSGEPVPVL